MYFTREDILKILKALLLLGIKDSEFKTAQLPLLEDDTITIVQNNVNRKVKISNIIGQFNILNRQDFINVSDMYDEHYITISEAIKLLPERKRKEGLVITFQNTNGDWQIYLFEGTIDLFINDSYWKDLFDFKYPIIDSILPDEEDLTLTYPDNSNNSFIKLKDKEYDTTNFSGMGTKIIRKNILETTLNGGTIKRINYLSSDTFNSENIIYEIRYDFDLNGLIVNIPNNCVLKFNGGNIYNGTIVGNNTTMINFVDEILTENSCKYSGSFVSNIVYHYDNIEDVKSKNHFPGQHLLTYSYYKGDTAGGDYLVITTLQGIEDNSFFLNYWVPTNPVCKTGLYTKIYNDLWIKYVTRSSTVNLGIFGVKFDANYYKDGLWYSDEECTQEATDNAYYFQNAIGLLLWWALYNIPRYIYIPSRFVINKPILLYHGDYLFTLIGNPYFAGQITTNREIECLMYNVYNEDTVANLTGNTYNIDGISFNGNNLAYDCLVLKNGYEADCIKNCLFNNAKCSGVRCWGVSSTFKLFNISAFDNGKYGLLLCEHWTHNNIKYLSNFEGVASFYGVSGDNNRLGLVGIDISSSAGASINIQHLKCEDRISEDNCAIRVVNSVEAMDINITNSFTNASCPFIILEALTVNEGTFRLNSVFNNFNFKTESELPLSTIIIDDRFRNKKVYNHARGSSCVNMIYTTHYDSKTFHHGLSLYRNGELVGGLCGELNIPSYNTYANLVKIDASKYLTLPIQVTDYDNNVAFKLDNSFIDGLGRPFYNPIETTIEINTYNQYEMIDLNEVSINDILKCTLSTTSYVGKIDIYLTKDNVPQYLVKSYNIDTDTTSTFYFTRNRLKESFFTLSIRMYDSNSTGTVSIKIIRNANIVPLLSSIEGIVSPTIKRIGTSQEREYGYNGFMYFDTTLNRPIYSLDKKWINSEGVTADTNHFGNFANKPTVSDNLIPIGFKYFCTDKQTSEGATNGIEIIHKGNDVWVDALGREVN